MGRDKKAEMIEKLHILGKRQGSLRLSDLAEQMGLNSADALVFLRQIFPVGSGLEVYHEGSELWVDLKSDSIQYMLSISPIEWVELYKVLSEFSQVQNPALNSLKKKILENGPLNTVMEILIKLDQWDQSLTSQQQDMIALIERSIAQELTLDLITIHEKKIKMFPYKVIHLEGQLSLIGEDSKDHCLFAIATQEIRSCLTSETHKKPKASAFEIEEFISAIRAMGERETRLVLKIHHPESINLFPDHQFLGKPCMVTNPEGDLIWAAYVEPCEALYEWLLNLGRNVEILDPTKFKDQYLMYCEEKLKKIA